MSSLFRSAKPFLQGKIPTVIASRGSVIEKCTPPAGRGGKKIKRLQLYYQNEENKQPIHLKGGMKDQILYRLTMALSVAGLGLQAYHFYHMAMPFN